MMRHYACNKHPSYSIRNHYFVNGLFATADPDVQRLIESADGYGVIIHPVETAEEIEQMKRVEEAARKSGELPEKDDTPIAVQGARGTQAGKGQRKGMVIDSKKN